MNDLLEKVRKAFAQSLSIDEDLITEETTPDHVPGWDSMGHVALGSAIEEVFGISLDVDDMMEMEDVKSIIRIVQKRMNL